MSDQLDTPGPQREPESLPSPDPEVEPGHVPPPAPVIRRTRISTAWAALIAGALVSILVLVFVLENLTMGRFAFFGLHFSLPLGVAVLLAAIVGVFIMAIVGSARIHQVRQALSRPRRGR